MCLFCLLCIAEFYVLLTVHPGMIVVNNQLDAQIVRQVGYLQEPVTLPVLIIRACVHIGAFICFHH